MICDSIYIYSTLAIKFYCLPMKQLHSKERTFLCSFSVWKNTEINTQTAKIASECNGVGFAINHCKHLFNENKHVDINEDTINFFIGVNGLKLASHSQNFIDDT